MKRIIVALMALVMLLPAVSYAETKDELSKEQRKELKKKIKEFNKGKWTVLGSRTLEGVVRDHYVKLAQLGEDGREVLGISTRTKSKNAGQMMAKNNAVNLYASDAASNLQARLVSDLQADGSGTDAEFEHFYAAFERLLETEVKGEIMPSFSLIRQNADGSYEVQTYCIVSESAASKARIRAAETALKESEAAQKYAEKISQYVREGF